MNNVLISFFNSETLRRRPPLAMLTRQCSKHFQLKNPNLTIETGTLLLISISALHHDPKYWNDSYKFDPDRFNDANHSGKSFIERPYFPFGAGPRTCIGMKMGKMQAKTGVVLMLQKFRFELADEHIGTELKYSPSTIFTIPKDGIRLKVFRR